MVVKHWTKLPREAVDAPPLEILKVKLEEPDWVEGAPAHGKGVGPDYL